MLVEGFYTSNKCVQNILIRILQELYFMQKIMH